MKTRNVAMWAHTEGRAFSWLSTGQVCEKWAAHYAALGFWGRDGGRVQYIVIQHGVNNVHTCKQHYISNAHCCV